MARSSQRRLTAGIGVLVSTILLTACASSPGAPSGQSQGSASADTAALEKIFKGNEGLPPTSSPPPAKDKDIWWISPGESSQGAKEIGEAAKEAVEAMGWTFHLADGNNNVANGFATAMRTALAARPDAIIEYAFSCTTVQPELQQAKQLGIPVIGLATLDCSDTGTGPSLFTVPVKYSETYPDNQAFWRGWGEWSGNFLAADSGGKAKIITAHGKGDPQFDLLKEGFDKALKECSGCEVVAEVPWTVTDLAPNGPWVSALRNALVQHPDADYVWWPFDTNAGYSGGAKAVLQSGSKAKVVSGGGAADVLDLVRAGQVYADGLAWDGAWATWGAVDELNRHFNGEPAVPEGIGFVAVDKSHNLPSSSGETYTSAVDFRSLYKKAWGVD